MPSLSPLMRRILPVLALLSAVAPLSTDMYLPAFPELSSDFGIEASQVQLTLTAFLLGLALGQLCIGPLSDGWGRRRPLLIGTAICFFATLACALAPDALTLTVARFVQGVSGAAGVVLARAIIADTSQGPVMAKTLGIMMMIGGVAPIAAPAIGSALVLLGGWRAVFYALAALVALMFIGVWKSVPETLPPAARHTGGLGTLVRNAGRLLSNRIYTGYLLTQVSAFAVLFAYISASSFILQDVLGLSPQAFGVAFGVNAFLLVGTGAVCVRLVGRVPLRRMVGIGLVVVLTATLALLVSTWVGTRLWLALSLIGLAIGSLGLVFGNAAALALGAAAHSRGTASAFLGACQFAMGALVSPLAGLGGRLDARPMALVMFLSACLALAAFLCLTKSTDPQ